MKKIKNESNCCMNETYHYVQGQHAVYMLDVVLSFVIRRPNIRINLTAPEIHIYNRKKSEQIDQQTQRMKDHLELLLMR